MTRPNDTGRAADETLAAADDAGRAANETLRAADDTGRAANGTVAARPDEPRVIEIDVRGLSRDEGHDAAFGALAAALGRGERFAAVVLVPDQPAANDGRGSRRLAHLRWLKANRPALAERCAGIAFVMSAELTRGSAKLLAAGSKVMGCAVSAHRTADAAHAWARQR